MFLWMKRITHFLDFLDLSTTEDDFSESLKQESSGLVTGDTASLFLGTTGKGSICNRPIGIVFSRNASTPIRDISNLGVVCDAISMS